jgi:hypothetical protein
MLSRRCESGHVEDCQLMLLKRQRHYDPTNNPPDYSEAIFFNFFLKAPSPNCPVQSNNIVEGSGTLLPLCSYAKKALEVLSKINDVLPIYPIHHMYNRK